MDTDPHTGTDEDYYRDYYDTLIDECLSVIANSAVPYQAVMEFKWGGYIEEDTVIDKLDKTCYYTFGVE